jgi:hypothetical protein
MAAFKGGKDTKESNMMFKNQRKEDFEEVDDGIVFVEEDIKQNFESLDLERYSEKENDLEKEYGVSQSQELNQSLKGITDHLIPTIKEKLIEYEKVYSKSNQLSLKAEVLDALQSAHKTDNEVIRQISDEYLNMDDEILALSSLEVQEIREKSQDAKEKILEKTLQISKLRLKLKQFQIANHILKTRLAKYIA